MKAAVITSFNHPPQYADIAEPVPKHIQEMQVDVLAAGLHHLTRGRASGAHYSSDAVLPFVPGVDGVGRGADGTLRYFVQAPGQPGSMAEKTVIMPEYSLRLPEVCDPIRVAAAMNPAMASWLALRCRTGFLPGQKVLILGATGSSGQMAVQVALYQGAAGIIATGRNQQKLAALADLGATDTVTLTDPKLGQLASEVDVVLDFIWGENTGKLMMSLLKYRKDRTQQLTWIHVGSMAGEEAPIPGALLRSADVQIIGSGLGAVDAQEILTELPLLVSEIVSGRLFIDVNVVPLSEVSCVWNMVNSSERIVLTP